MTPKMLSRKIRRLRARLPISTEFERVLQKRGTWRGKQWYRSQKEHWLGWLSEYHGPGYYGRKDSYRSSEFVYNHIVCPPMVLWLAEASGVPKSTVAKAKRAALSAKPSFPAQCAAIRKVIPWELIKLRLGNLPSKNAVG